MKKNDKLFETTEKITKKVDINNIPNKKRTVKHPFVNLFLFLALVSSVVAFIVSSIFNENNINSFSIMINCLLLVIFTIFFVSCEITNNKKKKGTVIISCIMLILYNSFFTISNCGLIKIPSINKVEDFTGKSLVEVIDWASKNNVELVQQYEYSDMIDEYLIISQNVKAGVNSKNIKNITVSVSEGASPYKEVVVPSMVTWNSERVLKFIKTNNLSNVSVEFIESDKVKDTVIEQSNSGNIKRNDEIKLTFSRGEEDEITDTKLQDLSGLSKFEVEFYLKQHGINYEIKEDFSNKIRKNHVISQSIKSGKVIKKDNDEKIEITISRGKEITIPNLKKMSMKEITNFIIKNKLKLEFIEKYDDNVKDNKVISTNYNKGDKVSEGSLISIVVSKGKIIMQKFDSLDSFYDWANKYGIKYEEKHEFNDNIAIGKVISYSHKTGDVVKNNDTIIVTISDGKEISVPNLEGKSKSEVTSILKKLGLECNFVYKSSNSINKDKVISQSISSGSKVSDGTTITVTLSSGKKEETHNRVDNDNSTNNSNNNNNNNSNNNNGNNNNNENSCISKTYTIGRDIRNIFNSNNSYADVSAALYSYFSANYPNVKFNVTGSADTGMSAGSYVGGLAPGDSVTSCNGVTYTIVIAK